MKEIVEKLDHVGFNGFDILNSIINDNTLELEEKYLIIKEKFHIENQDLKYTEMRSHNVLYRARKGYVKLINQNENITKTISVPFSNFNISAPPNIHSKLNRFNLPGNSVLYLASNIITAIEEINSTIGEFLSVGSF